MPLTNLQVGALWTKLGLPSPEVLAFNQGAPSCAESRWGKFWSEVKDMLGQTDTVNDRLKQAVEGRLTAQERFELAKQEKEFYKKQMDCVNRGLGWGIDMPNLTHYPLIAKRDQMLKDAEQNILRMVRNRMTLAEVAELDDQFSRYATAMKSYRSTAGFKLRPQPGGAVNRFFRAVADAVEGFRTNKAA